MPDSPAPDIALPFSFDAGYGAGLDRGLSLGGGGLFFIAWQVAYLSGLATEGVDLGRADRVVGTSAGSVVGAGLLGGRLERMRREVTLLARLPALVSLMAGSMELSPARQRAWDRFEAAQNAEPETIRAIGHAALAAPTPSPAGIRRSFAMLLGSRAWPSQRLWVSCVDTYTGERCVVTDRTGVPVTVALAASTSLPGIYSPQPIGERFCMDGGVSGSALHLDLLAGSKRTLVLALLNEADAAPGMTFATNATGTEIDNLVRSGTEVEVRLPEAVDLEEIMLPSALPKAVKMGQRQAARDAPGLRRFWG